jgi:formamidopyrimidine-DNA glycosylase
MPELPEVETTRRGIEPYILGQTIDRLVIREARLRWPISPSLPAILRGRRIDSIARRGKYLLLGTGAGTLLMHLGMSGSLRVIAAADAARKHDHVDIVLGNSSCLRFHDPRRFGAILWTQDDPHQHCLLASLGPEPLEAGFSGAYLHARASGLETPVKSFLMNSRIVAGVGNIYANEALYRAAIDPRRSAGRISKERYRRLAESTRKVLLDAIERGGTTLRDFVNESGRPGYFQQTLEAYGRGGLPCPRCHTPIRVVRLGQRSTFYCSRCQRY